MVWCNAQPDYRQSACLLPWKPPIVTFVCLPFKCWQYCELFKDRFFRSLSLCTSQCAHVNNQFPFLPLPLNDSAFPGLETKPCLLGFHDTRTLWCPTMDLAFKPRYFVGPEPVVSCPWFSPISLIHWNKNNLPQLWNVLGKKQFPESELCYPQIFGQVLCSLQASVRLPELKVQIACCLKANLGKWKVHRK